MILRLTGVLLIILCGPLNAQTVSLRSGEHGDFTRLVLDLPTRMSWEVDEMADSVRVSLSGRISSFDTSQVFSRIDRSRIADVSIDLGMRQIRIDLACDCVSSAFLLRERMLVVDIFPSSEVRDFPSDQSEDPDGFVRPTLDISFSPASRLFNGFLPTASELISQSMVANKPKGQNRISALSDELTKRLSRATKAGLLSQNDTPDADVNRMAETTTKKTELDSSKQRYAVSDDTTTLLNRETKPDQTISIGGLQCIEDNALNIETWSNENNRLGFIENRDRIIAASGGFSREVIQTGAEQLIANGFGAEARALVELGDANMYPVLLSLSYLVDGVPDETKLFERQHPCIGRASLWSALSLGREMPSTLSSDAVVRSFDMLPEPLKYHLGVGLVQAFADADRPEAASEVFRRLDRLVTVPSPELELLRVELKLPNRADIDTVAQLETLSRGGRVVAPDALLVAIELANDENRPVADDLVELTASLVKEAKGTPDAPNFWRSHIQSLLLSERFEAAYTVLLDSEGLADAEVALAVTDFLLALTESADDVSFLRYATRAITIDDGPSMEAKLGVASRLVDLRLPDNALKVLDSMPPSSNNRPVQILRARTLLELSRPEEAEIGLIGLRGDDVSRLRAQARRLMGDHTFAVEAYREIGEETAVAEAAWLAGDWETLAASPAVPLRDIAQELSASVDSTAANEPTSVQSAQTFVDNSETSRRTVQSMLEATRIPPDN